jgi:O-antigen ligase
VISILVEAPRWLFLVALVFGPWVYGSTRPWAMVALDLILATVIVLWIAGCAARRKRPMVPWLLAVSALLLLLQGWGMILNAQASYDMTNFQFIPVKQLLPFAPGDVDTFYAIPTMFNDSVMLVAICFAADLAQRPIWRTRIWWTSALNGIALMIWGLGMKVCGVYITSYLDAANIGYTSFAFYFYHGNAGSYINLILPLVGGLAVLAFVRRDAQAQRSLWLPGLLICIASSEAAGSKAGMVISLGLLIALAVWLVRSRLAAGRLQISRAQMIILIAAGALTLMAMLSLGWYGAAKRWAELGSATGQDESLVERLLVSQVCFHMMPDSGFWGFGPGNFVICFPHYTAYLKGAVDGIWFYAHEDYLQAIVEWGYVGAAILGVIFFGGIWTGWRRLRGTPLAETDSALLAVTLMALAGVAIHASCDFPLQIASLQLYVATYLGICWGSPGFGATSARVSQRRSSARRSGIQAPAGGAA